MTEIKPLNIATLSPPLNAVLVQDAEGLRELSVWLAEQTDRVLGLDLESNVVGDFWYRKARTIQLGNKTKQWIIDLLSFAGSEEVLVSSQGNYGAENKGLYKD